MMFNTSEDRSRLGPLTVPGRRNAPQAVQPLVLIETPQSRQLVSIEQLGGVLWKSRALLFACAVVGICAGLLVAYLSHPVYRARTSIRLDGNNEKLVGDAFGANASADGYLNNELKVIQSDTLARRVAERLRKAQVKTSRTTQSATPADEGLVKAVKAAATFRSTLKSQIVDIAFDAADPQLAADGANAFTQEYVALSRETRAQTVKETTAWLLGQIGDLKQKLDKGNEGLQQFAHSAGLLLAANQGLITQERVRQLQEALSRAQATRMQRQSVLETALASTPESMPAAVETDLLKQQQSALAALQQELAQVQSMFTPAHYKVRDLQERIAKLQDDIRLERKNVVDKLSAEYDSGMRVERSLAQALSKEMAKLERETGYAFEYNVLKREVDSTQTVYDSLLQKVKEASVASAMNTTTIRVIDPARPPEAPYSPKLPLDAAVGLLSGLAAAVSLVFVKEPRGDTIHAPGDLRTINVREIGVIPAAPQASPLAKARALISRRSEEGARLELTMWHDAPSLLTESFRAALASIVLPERPAKPHKVIVISSLDPMEGKTTVLTNLGMALTETNRRVLLIDADLRSPRLQDVFNKCNDSGVSTLLAKETPIDARVLQSYAQPTEVPGLYVIPSGPGAAKITNLFFTPRLPELLSVARSEFDFVLIDTPPLGLFSDARILGKTADSMIMVVRAFRNSGERLKAVHAQLAEDGVLLLGAILNRCNSGPNETFYRERYSRYRPSA